jgi:hypothetical protein
MQPHALPNILSKIFARGFYKVHSGLLVFLFVSLISYCFFINTAGDIKLMSSAQALFYNFILLITFVSSPLMTIIFFMAWLFYSIKSWQYVAATLRLRGNEFLFYSTNSFSAAKQFKGWFYTQFIISLPFVCYGFIAVVTGIVFKHYAIAVLIITFTVLLIAISAWGYIILVGQQVQSKGASWVFMLSRRWRKPFFTLPMFHVFNALKLGYGITKVLSYVIIIGMLFCFADVRTDLRVAAIIVLGIATAHAMLTYQQYKFGETYLYITRNFPYGAGRLYVYLVLNCLLLLLPEVVWILLSFNLAISLFLVIMLLSIILLFHCVLHLIGAAMKKYLPCILALFIGLFWLILFGGMWLVMPLCLVISFALFYFNYHKAEAITGYSS